MFGGFSRVDRAPEKLLSRLIHGLTPGGCLRDSPDPGSGTSIAVIQDVWLDVRDCVMDVLSTMDLAHMRDKLQRKHGATVAELTREVLAGRP